MFLIAFEFYFVMSAFLMTKTFLNDEKKLKKIKENNLWENIKLIFKDIRNRYIRLAPPYIMRLILSEIAVSYTADVSLFSVFTRSDLLFSK